jgi:hypothetical protein
METANEAKMKTEGGQLLFKLMAKVRAEFKAAAADISEDEAKKVRL